MYIGGRYIYRGPLDQALSSGPRTRLVTAREARLDANVINIGGNICLLADIVCILEGMLCILEGLLCIMEGILCILKGRFLYIDGNFMNIGGCIIYRAPPGAYPPRTGNTGFTPQPHTHTFLEYVL